MTAHRDVIRGQILSMGKRGGRVPCSLHWRREEVWLHQTVKTRCLTSMGHAFSMSDRPPTGSLARRDHLLGLAPGDGIHAAVGQEVRAVPDLHIDDTFFCFRFYELVGDPPHRLTVTPAGTAVGPITGTCHPWGTLGMGEVTSKAEQHYPMGAAKGSG